MTLNIRHVYVIEYRKVRKTGLECLQWHIIHSTFHEDLCNNSQVYVCAGSDVITSNVITSDDVMMSSFLAEDRRKWRNG